MSDIKLVCSDDYIKHRPHIHYLMKYLGNCCGAIATYNSKNKTITFKEEAIPLLPEWVADFVKCSTAIEERPKDG